MENKPHEEPVINVKFGPEDDVVEPPTRPPRRSFVEMLLDPRTLHGLMLCGGGLLVLGLVVWLWSIGVFDNPLVVAVCLGVGNAALLGAGIAAVRYSRYQTAGKATTLLACLVMPLNLWFYDAQGLVTLDQGGHLWVPALVCCAIYVAVARVLADAVFVYAIVGGITMTGMLFLADRQVGRFWEIMAPSTFLVVLGMICIHVERAFAPGDGPFSREKFGRAFFNAGHLVMATGLVLLLAGRLVGRLYDPYFAQLDWFAMPAVATQANLKLLALALALGAAYSYVYSQVVVAARGRYVASAVLTLLWCAVILFDLLAITFTMELLTLAVAVAGLIANLSLALGPPAKRSSTEPGSWDAFTAPLTQSAASIAAGLNATVVVFGAILYARARCILFDGPFSYDFGWMYVAAMLLGGVSCWLRARRAESGSTLHWNLQGVALTATFATAAALASWGIEVSVATLAIEMLVPLTIAIVSLVSQPVAARPAWSRAAELAAMVVLLVGLSTLIGLVETVAVAQPHVWLVALFGCAAVCFGLASIHATRMTSSLLAAACICATVWQLLLLVGVTRHEFIFATTLVGVVCLTISAVSTSLRRERSRLATVTEWTGRVCVSFGGVAAILMSLGRLLVSETEWSLFGLLIAQIVAATLAGLLAKQAEWRRHFLVLAVAEMFIMLLVVNSLSALTFFQRMEVLLTVVGLLMLAGGYVGWYRETNRREEWVSFNLFIGSLLTAVPITIGLAVQRFGNDTADWGWVLLHEGGALAIGMGLLAAGVLCRIRWSTLAGATTMLVYIVSLLGLVELPDQLQTTAVYMMVGGGLFFGVAVLLSIYRDRLLALPKQVQEGEGVFSVLKWR